MANTNEAVLGPAIVGKHLYTLDTEFPIFNASSALKVNEAIGINGKIPKTGVYQRSYCYLRQKVSPILLQAQAQGAPPQMEKIFRIVYLVDFVQEHDLEQKFFLIAPKHLPICEGDNIEGFLDTMVDPQTGEPWAIWLTKTPTEAPVVDSPKETP